MSDARIADQPEEPIDPNAPFEVAVATPMVTRNFQTKGLSLRQFAARGMMVNTGFTVFLSVLSLVRGFVLAALMTREDYGVWGLLMVSLGTLLWLKQVGIGDKYIQQDEEDQEVAFQRAFTLEVIFTGVAMIVLGLALPIYAAIYGQWQIVAPGIVVLLMLPAGVLQAPLWAYYRNMDFLRQRLLQAIDPVVGFAVAIILATSGAGYWALAGGVLAGAWASALVIVVLSPFKLRFRYDSGTTRSYLSFSWPLLVANGSSVVIAQSAVIVAQRSLGLAAVGAMALASTIDSFTHRVDHLVTGTLYPAICAVKDRVDLLEETFTKSNRLGLMWAMPFGCGVGLFAGDLVTFGIGEEWRPAAELMSVIGFVAAVSHLGFNWDAYMRALGRTRPLAVASVSAMVVYVAAGIPLLLAFGLRGFAAGIALQAAIHLAVRMWYMSRLFHGFSFVTQAARAAAPTVPAIAVVVLARVAESGQRTLLMAGLELVAYAAVVGALTWRLERGLLREAVGYLSRRVDST